jgi:hypothetical protein
LAETVGAGDVFGVLADLERQAIYGEILQDPTDFLKLAAEKKQIGTLRDALDDVEPPTLPELYAQIREGLVNHGTRRDAEDLVRELDLDNQPSGFLAGLILRLFPEISSSERARLAAELIGDL